MEGFVSIQTKRINTMRDITLEELLSAGCHFGHQVNRRNPKADEFIFESRSNVHIIDLGKTREGLIKAAQYIHDLAARGGTLMVVGTKRQAKLIVKEEIERAQKEGVRGLFYTTSRWVGGTFTNYPEVSKNFKKLSRLNELLASDDSAGYTKRELLLFDRERAKLREYYDGIASMDKIPDALFIVDTHLESTAIHEANEVGAMTVGIVDTNADPAEVTYSIPANDDAVGSIKLITNYLINAWIEGQKKGEADRVKREEESVKEKVKEEKKAEEVKVAEPKAVKKEADSKVEKGEKKPKEKPAKKAVEKKTKTSK